MTQERLREGISTKAILMECARIGAMEAIALLERDSGAFHAVNSEIRNRQRISGRMLDRALVTAYDQRINLLATSEYVRNYQIPNELKKRALELKIAGVEPFTPAEMEKI